MALPPAADSALRPRSNPFGGDSTEHGQATTGSIPPSFYNPRPSKPNALSKLLNPASLHIEIDNPLVFLHPQAPSLIPDEPGPPSDDTVLSGKVTLSLLKPREVKKLSVGVRGYSDIGFPDRPFETRHLFSQDLDIDLRTQALEKGEHVFEWSFIIPSSTAPYERGPFGRTYHKVVAKVRGGGGIMGDLEAEAYWEAVCNPSGNDPNGELSLGVHFEDHSPQLGPYMIALTSSLFTVSGLLGFQLSLANIPGPVMIHFITCHILQHFTLQAENGKTARPPPQKRKVFRIDGGANPPGIRGRGGWMSQTLSRSVSRAPSPSGTPSPLPSPGDLDRAVAQPQPPASQASPGNLSPPEPPPRTSQTSPDNLAQTLTRRLQFRDPSPTTTPTTSRPSTPDVEDRERSRTRDRGRQTSHDAGRGGQLAHSRGRDKGKKKATAEIADAPLAELFERGQSFEVHHIARLPNDDNLRPSTHPGTVAPIRVTHSLTVEVVYSALTGDPSEKRKMLTLTKPVHIVSCCCMLESMTLPPYSEWDPHAEMQDPGHQRVARMGCVCGMSTAQLLRTQDPTATETMKGQLPPGAFPPKPPDSR